MIELTDVNGRKRYLSPAAIASVAEAGPSGAWHGIRAYVRLFDSSSLEVRETPQVIIKAMAADALALRIDPTGLSDDARLAVMAQNPVDHHHWSRPVGWFTAGEVRAAIAQRERI